MPAPKTGHDCKLYYNSGSYQTETLVEIDEIEDLNVSDFAYALAELKRRKTRWNLKLATTLSAAIEFKLLNGLGASVFTALRTAFLARTPTEFWVLDGASDVTGVQGLRLTCLITQFPWDQPLEDIASHPVRLEPTYKYDATEADELLPEWVTVS